VPFVFRTAWTTDWDTAPTYIYRRRWEVAQGESWGDAT